MEKKPPNHYIRRLRLSCFAARVYSLRSEICGKVDHMEQLAREKDSLHSRLRSIENDLSEASRAISGAESKVASVDASMGALPSRLASVRGRGYLALGHLDKTIELLTTKWADAGPMVKQSLATSLQPMGAQIRTLQIEAGRLRGEIDRAAIASANALAS